MATNEVNDLNIEDELNKVNLSIYGESIELWRTKKKCRGEFFMESICFIIIWHSIICIYICKVHKINFSLYSVNNDTF